MNNTDAIQAEGVSKAFHTPAGTTDALKEVSFSVKKGSVTGLIGPDAAGKTTLMRIFTGLLVPEKGKVSVLGMDPADAPRQVQSQTGYMPQRFGLYEDLSVQKNMDLYADLQGLEKKARKDTYQKLMEMTRLGEFRNRPAGKLSGGMKQKLGLSCALIRSPGLLLLDEPTAGVDPVSRRELWNIVFEMVKQEGMTVLLSTAYLEEAERCDRVILLRAGKVLKTGVPKTLEKAVKGRVFQVNPDSRSKREVKNRLYTEKNIVDAVILGDSVRVVVKEGQEENLKEMLQKNKGKTGDGIGSVESVDPRFEDAYMDLIAREENALPDKQKGMEQKQEAREQMQEEKPVPGISGFRTETELPPGEWGDDAGEGDTLIFAENLKRRFGNFYAVKGISFSVGKGEVFGLLGANGAGKTTTFRMLCGLLPATKGKLRVAGQDMRKARSKARAKIGYMSQTFSLYGNLSVKQNLSFFSHAYNLTGKKQKQRIKDILADFGLTGFADTQSSYLPVGYKQRLSLAAALLHTPKILFLDEPTSGVDPLARREFWQHIHGLAEKGVTVMVTTHFMEEAEYCDRIGIMRAGKILSAGSANEIKNVAQNQAEEKVNTMEDAFVALMKGDANGEEQ